MPRVTELKTPYPQPAQEPDTGEHALQRDRVRASILAVQGEPTSHQPADTKPALFNRIASPGATGPSDPG